MISYIRLIINNLSIVGYAIYPPMFPLFTHYDGTTAIAPMIAAYGHPYGWSASVWRSSNSVRTGKEPGSDELAPIGKTSCAYRQKVLCL